MKSMNYKWNKKLACHIILLISISYSLAIAQEYNDDNTVIIDESKTSEASTVQTANPERKVNNTSSRNENRTGIRLNFCYLHGGLNWALYNRQSGEYIKNKTIPNYYDSICANPGYNNLDEQKYLFRIQFAVMIKAGPYFSMDVGPSLMIYRENGGLEYTDLTNSTIYVDDEYKLSITAPGVTFGANFVKRLYPIKINAGILADVNINIVSWKQKLSYPDTYDQNDVNERARDVKVNVSVGPRAGVEFMAGEQVGFNIDFLYRFYLLESNIDIELMKLSGQGTNFNYTTTSVGDKWQFRLPGFGGGAGINFYF